MKMKLFVSLAIAALVAAGSTTTATAVTNSDITLSDIETIVSNNNVRKVAVDTDKISGKSLITYVDANDGNKTKGVIVDSSLAVVGSPFVIFNNNGGQAPAVAWNGENSLWLAVQYRNEAVYTNTVALDGTVGTSATAINAGPAGESISDVELVVASYSPDLNKFLVATKATVSGSVNCQILLGVYVSADGSTSTGPNGADISGNTSCDYYIDNGLSAEYSAHLQKWLVAYYVGSTDAAFDDKSAVNLVGGSSAPADESAMILLGDNLSTGSPGIAYNSETNEFYAAWAHDGVNEYFTRGAIVAADGLSAGAAFDVIAEGVAPGPKPRIVYNSYSKLFIASHYVWDNFEESASRNNIVVTTRDSDGVITAPLLISDGTESAQRPDASNLGDCVLVVWQSGLGVRGRTVCAPEGSDELANTGFGASVLLAVAAVSVVAGAIATRRARRKA